MENLVIERNKVQETIAEDIMKLASVVMDENLPSLSFAMGSFYTLYNLGLISYTEYDSYVSLCNTIKAKITSKGE